MATPYDAAAKDLIELAPADWLAFLGQPRPPELVRVIDADLSSTVSTATDKVIRVDDPEPWLALIELQAAWDRDLPFDLLRRYALLRHRHRLPVSCVIVLLRPEANTSAMSGTFTQPDRLGRDWDFPFHVVRVWEIPAERLLQGPLALLPLAPITAVDQQAARPVISEVRERLQREATRSESERLWNATSILLAFRFQANDLDELRDFMASVDLFETSFARLAQGIGAIREARTMLLELGAEKFGPVPAEVEATIQAIEDIPELRRLTKRVIAVSSWQELLAR
jgi:hypothetical protein